MNEKKKIFFKKKILIYGLGKTGISSYLFLKKNNQIYFFDDNKKNLYKKKKNFLNLKNIHKIIFDYILVSPGIDIKKCKLKNFIKSKKNKIITDLDIFYTHNYNNLIISITGTNGKSTTAKILFNILKDQNKDVRLAGNIGNAVLNEKKVTKKTIFVIEISSYQIDYSKFFRSEYAAILNISPDHLERHGNINNYVNSKLKLIKKQSYKSYSFLNTQNRYLKKFLRRKEIKSKIIDVKENLFKREISRIKNPYFLTYGNRENLRFIFSISEKLKLKKIDTLNTLNNFKGLNFRQQIIYNSNNLSVINDSKATSFSSSENILDSLKRVYWLVGGIPKLGDKFLMPKNKCKNFTAYIYGKNKNFFIENFKNKIRYKTFGNLKEALKNAISDIKLEKIKLKKTILFSPSAASFDVFKNFEDRGKKFNNLFLKTYLKK